MSRAELSAQIQADVAAVKKRVTDLEQCVRKSKVKTCHVV